MTREEKQILLKDLCTRLPYKVKGLYQWKGTAPFDRELTGNLYDELSLSLNSTGDSLLTPYLRPMSSMTDEECKELGDLPATIEDVCETLPNIPYYIEVARPEQLDLLNAHHFDYHRLIEKGLALEAPEGMYKIE